MIHMLLKPYDIFSVIRIVSVDYTELNTLMKIWCILETGDTNCLTAQITEPTRYSSITILTDKSIFEK